MIREGLKLIYDLQLATLHTTVTSASFFAAASFHFSSTTLSSVAHMSQALLSSLDAILGSTESSRAIAAIITLIRREFRGAIPNPDAEYIGVGDLLVGSVGFALLQSWGRRNTERYLHENGGYEMIWDVVILDNGMRADVVRTSQIEFPDPPRDGVDANKDEAMVDTIQRRPSSIDALDSPQILLSPENQHASDDDIRLYIMKQLPRGCHASIKTDLVTARTITVDVFDDNNSEISPPPGTMVVEERFRDDPSTANSAISGGQAQRLPKHTVVFRTAFNQSQSANVRPEGGHDYFTPISAEPSTAQGSRHGAGADPAYDNSVGKIGASDHQLSQEDSHPSQNSGGTPNSHHPNIRGTSHAPQRQTKVPVPKQHRKSLSSSSQAKIEAAQKDTFGKGSFTRLAQKMKPTATEGNENAKPAHVRTTPEKPPSSMTNSAQSKRAPLSETNLKKALPPPPRISSAAANRGVPRSPAQESPGARPVSSSGTKNTNPRDNRRPRDANHDRYTVRGKNQESMLVQTDTYSSQPDTRPGSPVTMRGHVRSSSALSLTRSETDMTVSVNNDSRPGSSMHQRSKSFNPSIYSLATAGSETSLILAHRMRKSVYEDSETVQALNRDGRVPGIFPENHFVMNIRRFCRFSSASYGSNALKVMGVRKDENGFPSQESDSREHSDFSDHAGLPQSTILLSSFVDPAGGSNAAGETETGFPLVHFLCLDHESKAVVLTLRGTWGFEDILTDMTCDYDDLTWQGKNWKVHKGMHASAKRLLEGGGGRVMITIRAALEEFPDYGVVLCGHSLGGGVAALLATMISEPAHETAPTSFVTASYQSATQRMLPSNGSTPDKQSYFFLPPGRPIHVYAYGPPAVMSPFLRRATRGLITTIVNGQDVVPSLSLGILHDMHTVSLAFKSDTSGAKSNVRYRVWESLRQSIVNKFYVKEAPMLVHAGDGVGEDVWAWQTLKGLREEMHAPKLMPPGEVFIAETMRVLQRDAFTSNLGGDGFPLLGRPATRVQLRFIRDVETVFGELRFGSGMLSDHNPARYEASLAALARGILDD